MSKRIDIMKDLEKMLNSEFDSRIKPMSEMSK